MFGNWFSDDGDNGQDKDQHKAAHSQRRGSRSRSAGPLMQPASSFESAALSPASTVSAHDAAIASMNEKIHQIRLADALASGDVQDTKEEANVEETEEHRAPENVYDPFDGQRIGVMIPGQLNKAEDDLWTHLAHIRNLQSDIAKMHAHMEGLGENERSQVDEEVANEDEEVKASKFARLGDRFNGRKEAIEGIMSKLDTLSRAMNDFHASRAPLFQFEEQSPLGAQNSDATSGSLNDGDRNPSKRSAPKASVSSTRRDTSETDQHDTKS